jgi:Flp pilus assembly pilin Flp
MVNRMKQFLMNLWQDEQGAETAEWLVIVALVSAVGIALYNGVLQPALTGLINNISADITAL